MVCSHHVRRDQTEVEGDGGERDGVADAVVLVNPTAQLLQQRRGALELLPQRNQ